MKTITDTRDLFGRDAEFAQELRDETIRLMKARIAAADARAAYWRKRAEGLAKPEVRLAETGVLIGMGRVDGPESKDS